MEDDLLANDLPKDVIAVSSPSSQAASPPMVDLNEPAEIDVMFFIPMDNGEQLMINPHEIQEDDLMNDDELMAEAAAQVQDQLLEDGSQQAQQQNLAQMEVDHVDDQQQAQHDQQHEHASQAQLSDQSHQLTNLGFVQLLEPEIDPGFAAYSRAKPLPADIFRIWSRHFEPINEPSLTEILAAWVPFFTAALMNPSSFQWAKQFLTSAAWEFFSPSAGTGLPFSFPAKCPSEASPSCLHGDGQQKIASIEEILEVSNEASDGEDIPPRSPPIPVENAQDIEAQRVSPSTGPWSAKLLQRAGKLQVTEDDPSLRRSCRMKAQKKGFIGNACADKRCFACESDPPTISPSIIKNLWATFCHVDPEKLAEPTVVKKKKASAPGEKKPAPKKKPKVDDDRTPKKKPKK